ncbi:MAG TPA: GDP-mannose 4,6-dehydratase, partial [Candidatus Latescibacteria bacterium]|nr:GDP-mannose 4,6-dehydratase [Candidatus Latescibacterota bacterium]
ERFFRPAEVNILLGDPAKASEKLGWKPETSFEKMVRLMVDHDLEMVAKQSE